MSPRLYPPVANLFGNFDVNAKYHFIVICHTVIYSLPRQKIMNHSGMCYFEKLKTELFSFPILSMETIVEAMKRIKLVLDANLFTGTKEIFSLICEQG